MARDPRLQALCSHCQRVGGSRNPNFRYEEGTSSDEICNTFADNNKLLTIDPADAPVYFDNKVGSGLAGHFSDLPLGRVHNVVINEELEYGVAVGASPRTSACRAGLIFFDLKDVSTTKTLGCDPQDGYVHDVSLFCSVTGILLIIQAQCLVYHGPDTKYEGRDICYGYNEDTLTM